MADKIPFVQGTDTDEIYDNLVEQNQENYNKLIDATEKYKTDQETRQEEAFKQTQQELEQAQNQAEKDYKKEQSAARADYEKLIAPHGVQAEAMAAEGLTGSGYSESARISAHNAYQSRLTAARESWKEAQQQYTAAMDEAKRLNSATLAEIAYKALETRVDLTLKGLSEDKKLKLEWLSWKM